MSKSNLFKLMVAVLVVTAIPFAQPKQAAAALSQPQISATNPSGITAALTLNSAGPYTQDFQYQVCWQTGNGQGTACVWSPWASASASGSYGEGLGISTPWTWNGPTPSPNNSYNWENEFGNGSHIYIGGINYQPLPANTNLIDVRIGIELTDDDKGSLAGTNNNLSCDNSFTAMTPLYGGSSGNAVAHKFGCNENSPNGTDEFRIFMSANYLKASTVGNNFPTTMTTGQTITNATIQVNNLSTTTNPDYPSQSSFYPNSTSYYATGTPSGNSCVTSDGALLDQNGNPVQNYQPTQPNEPDGPPSNGGQAKNYPPNYCNTPIFVTDSSDMALTHSGTFTTPQTVPYSYSGTLYEYWNPDTFIADPCPVCVAGQPCDSYDLNIIPTAEAAVGTSGGSGSCGYEEVPGSQGGFVNSSSASGAPGTSITFTIPSFTAPTTPGTYTESWTFTDSNGAVPGGVYSVTITVSPSGTAPSMNVHADRSTNWTISGRVSESGTGTDATYPNSSSNTPLQTGTYHFSQDPKDAIGFAISNPPPITLKNNSSILAQIVKTAYAASSCSGFDCYLDTSVPNARVAWGLTNTYCSVTINTTVNGQQASISNLPAFTISGPLLDNGVNNSQSFTSTPQTVQLVADSSIQTVNITSNLSNGIFPQTTTINGQTADLATDALPSFSCNANGAVTTVTAAYVTRASLQVH